MKYPIKKEKEITLSEFEILWGQPDCEDGLSLFKQSHASASDGVKADSSDLIILPVSCGDTLEEAKSNAEETLRLHVKGLLED